MLRGGCKFPGNLRGAIGRRTPPDETGDQRDPHSQGFLRHHALAPGWSACSRRYSPPKVSCLASAVRTIWPDVIDQPHNRSKFFEKVQSAIHCSEHCFYPWFFSFVNAGMPGQKSSRVEMIANYTVNSYLLTNYK